MIGLPLSAARILAENERPLLAPGPMGGIAHRVQHLPYVPDVHLEQGQRHGDADGLFVGASETKNNKALAVVIDEGADVQVLNSLGGDDDFGQRLNSFSDSVGDVGYDPEEIGVYFVRVISNRAAVGIYACRLPDLAHFVDETTDPDACEYKELRAGGWSFGGAIDLATDYPMPEAALDALIERQDREAFSGTMLTETWLEDTDRSGGRWAPVPPSEEDA